MPRVRVPHASLIASADLPVLPFLAPRVFAEPPSTGRSRLRDGRSNGIWKEKQETVTCVEEARVTQHGHGPRHIRPNYGTISRQQPAQEGFAAGLLQASGQRWTESRRPTPVASLYADISSYTRQNARSYSTTTSAIRRVPGKARLPPRQSTSLPPRQPASLPLRKQNTALASKRNTALVLEHNRLYDYISRLPPGLTAKERMKQGQYRSLVRRVSNLVRWDVTQLDLTKPVGSPGPGLNSAFAALERALYPALGKHTRKVVIRHDPRCLQLSLKLFPLDTSDSLAKVWKKWMALDLTTRTDYFQRLLIYLLDRKPGRALRFIQVLAKDSSLQNQRNEAIADALGYLSKIHITGAYGIKQNWHPDPEAHKRLFAPAFVKVYDEVLSAQPDVCSQDLLHNMIELAGPDDLKKVFDCLVKHRTKFGFETLLHYAGTFGEAGEVEYALRCLHELRIRHNAATWNKVVERPRLRFTCATILRKSMSASQDYHQTPTIVAKFVHLRIKMDILLYNVVMHNAMEAGDYATAFKVYNALDRNELEADKYTYSILLHGCALQNNPATFRSFAEHAVEVAKEIKDPWLATDYLYYLYVRHHADEDIGHTSALLWEAYCKLFSVAPLEPFLSHGTRDLRNASEAQRSGLESTLLSPPPVALYIMLQMEIRSALAISNQRVLSLYHNFKSLVNRASNPTFKTLVQNPTIWNAFLLAFCQKQQFASASQLIKDMTDGPIQPNVYSWNIFMQAFFKTGQIQAADRVFEIMRNRGIDPDQFTYGVLLRGYAKAQLVDRIGDIMPHVEREEEMDPDLLRALATVVDRNKLMATLEKGRIQKEATEQEEANREAEEERLRWDSIPNYIEFDPEVEGFGFLEDPTNVPSKPTPTFTQQAVASDSSDLDYIDEPINKSSGISESILEEPQIDRTVPAAAPSLVPETQTSNVRDTAQLEPKETPQPPPQSQKKWQLTPLSLPSSSRNPQDPETQYRMLQEQLGVIQPSPQPSQATFPSATLGLKSVRGGDGGISKVLPKFTIRKTMSSDRSEGPKDEASTAKRSKGRRKR